MYLRSEVVKLLESWVGKNKADGSYKEIIDIYNSQEKFPRSTKMQYDWAWCACTWSAVAIKLGYTEIMPVEISCGYLIEKAKEMGIWNENDQYIPSPGDAVLYDWQDNGKGDNKGWADHIGTIVSVDESTKAFTTIEGNWNGGKVARKRMNPNAITIRGFITPKYDDIREEDEVIEVVPEPIKDKYRVTTALYLRSGIGKVNKAICVLPENLVVTYLGNKGSDKNGIDWFNIEATVKGKKYTGYSSSKYLKKL